MPESAAIRDLLSIADGEDYDRANAQLDALLALAKQGEAYEQAKAWLAERFVDYEDDPTDKTLLELVQACFQWGDGAWSVAGHAQEKVAAYEQHLASARSLYGEQDPSTADLEQRVKRILPWVVQPQNFDGEDPVAWPMSSPEVVQRGIDALSELVIRAHGHVPVEALAAAETAREQAEKERDEAVKARDAMLAMVQAEPPPPQIVDEITRQTIGDLAADRDRLAAALDAIAFNAESWHGDDAAKSRALAVIAQWARDPSSIPAGVLDALAATQEQT